MNKKYILAACLCLGLTPVTSTMANASNSKSVQQTDNTFKGKVVDAQGEPVIGATVMQKGTTNGVITDFDGNFTLKNASGVVVISYIGCKSQEVKVTPGKEVQIVLKEDAEEGLSDKCHLADQG